MEMITTSTTTTSTTAPEDVTGFYCHAPYTGGYLVRPGDNLYAIAQRLYGDGRLWPVLFAANADQIRNPHLIYPGQVLRLG